ncbi:MAG: hypothetical protein ACOZIN_22400, partial [Myxococcota bacterium]
MKSPFGVSLAAAVATALITGCGVSGGAKESTVGQLGQEVKCQGINECKGTSECASKDGNSCQGLNECKGQGWITEPSAESCTSKGGTVIS